MPRIRTIKPQFWLSENLGSISRDARLLYIGLWNLSDDQGVFEYRPARIRIQLFPYDEDVTNETVSKWLAELLNVGNIITFGTNGDTFGLIPTFSKHQQIEKPSKWHYAEIPPDLLKNQSQHSTTIPLPLDDDSTTTPQPLSLGKRNREKEKVLGNREIDNDETLEKSVLKDNLSDGKKLKKYPPEFTPLRAQVFAGLTSRRGYASRQPMAEAKAISDMLAEKCTPEQILTAYDRMKKQPFYQDKNLSMMSVKKDIHEVLKNGENRGYSQKSSTTTLPTESELIKSYSRD